MMPETSAEEQYVHFVAWQNDIGKATAVRAYKIATTPGIVAKAVALVQAAPAKRPITIIKPPDQRPNMVNTRPIGSETLAEPKHMGKRKARKLGGDGELGRMAMLRFYGVREESEDREDCSKWAGL